MKSASKSILKTFTEKKLRGQQTLVAFLILWSLANAGEQIPAMDPIKPPFINASYDVPAGDTDYLITLLEFEDGKLSRRGLSLVGKTDDLGTRTMKPQLLWGTHEGKSSAYGYTACGLLIGSTRGS